MPDPVITLTTDFGTSDHFVGVMKGVILGIAPQARIVDITHDIAPFGVTEGAFAISQAYAYFPKNTIHVVVVDPGVGSARRPLLVETAGHFFVAPDNGVLSMIYSRADHKVRHITCERYFRQPVSPTFHGRDIFSPVAAHLAAGTAPARFGKLVQDPVRLALDQPTQTGKRTWTGAV
ncbi:MAG: SAM-dependent chlorinase/fluorinase, partial [Acidobacteriota bacterium]|nr:SAM-dependent chlorinase/fluorinase [Acidobacteriota bacterium]